MSGGYRLQADSGGRCPLSSDLRERLGLPGRRGALPSRVLPEGKLVPVRQQYVGEGVRARPEVTGLPGTQSERPADAHDATARDLPGADRGTLEHAPRARPRARDRRM